MVKVAVPVNVLVEVADAVGVELDVEVFVEVCV